MGRIYKDKKLQAAYDGYLAAYHSGARGWISPGVHGLWRENGDRFQGAAGGSAFWAGFDGLTLSGGRAMYIPTSMCRSAYMAGRDCRKSHEKFEARRAAIARAKGAK